MISVIFCAIDHNQISYSKSFRQILIKEFLDFKNTQQLLFLSNHVNKYSCLMLLKIVIQLIEHGKTQLGFNYEFDEVDERIRKFMNCPMKHNDTFFSIFTNFLLAYNTAFLLILVRMNFSKIANSCYIKKVVRFLGVAEEARKNC